MKKATLKNLRKELGFTQIEFAKLLNTTQATVSRIETGEFDGGKFAEYLEALVKHGSDINPLFQEKE